VEGTVASGYENDLGTRLFDIIEPFADYAFNKSHAFGYGLISYQTAYLKANYRVEFMAAVLTGVKHNLDKAGLYLNDCRQAGIVVKIPDVNSSEVDFSSKNGHIPFGLSAVRNVGEGIVSPIVEERNTNGVYEDFYDFCERVPTSVLNKRSIEALIKAGAFESCGHSRQGLLLVAEQVIDQVVGRRREADMGIQTLFGELDDAAGGFDERVQFPSDEVDEKTMLAWEKEMLGLYVSSHPLHGVEASLRRATDCSIGDAASQQPTEDGRDRFITVGGVISNLQRKFTRNGDAMAVFDLEDLQSSMEITVFPRTMSEHGHQLDDDAVVLVSGRVDSRDDEPKFIAHKLTRFEPTGERQELRLTVPAHQINDRLISELKALLSNHPGDTAVFLNLGKQVVRLPDSFRVEAGNGLAGELRVLLGPDAVLSS
jgi:DNA polymerase-3 subunit alpha